MNAAIKPQADFLVKDLGLKDWGRKEEEFTWERTDKAEVLAAEFKARRLSAA